MGCSGNNQSEKNIYKLTLEEKSLLREHDMFYCDLFYYGYHILDTGFSETIEDYELTIYSLIYRLLELLDTLNVMTQQSLINSAFIIVRSLSEVAVQLSYILVEENRIRQKATVLQMLDIKRTAKNEEIFYEQMERNTCYKEFVPLIKAGKANWSWYGFCEGKKTTIEDLFQLVGWEELSLYSVYKSLCIESHQLNHMETNITYFNDKFHFQPFRMVENHILLLDLVLRFIKPTFHTLIEVYGDERIQMEWLEYEKKLASYIKSNEDITNYEKLFYPFVKWF